VNITVDTNVFVRALIEDDAQQSPVAKQALSRADLVAVPTAVLCELVWVLAQGYKLDAQTIAGTIRGLMKSANVRLSRPAADAGLTLLEAGSDFADGVIAFEGAQLGGDTFVSFDKKAIKVLAAQGENAKLLE
jgi:predicted nucleic-acid-binding protein